MTRVALLFVLLFTACAPKAVDVHAEVLRVTHGVLDTGGSFINDECPRLIEVQGPAAHEACRAAGAAWNSAIAAWSVWANLTLEGLSDAPFNAGRAVAHARRVLELYLAAAQALDGVLTLPEPPTLLLQLLQASEPNDTVTPP